MTPPRLTDEQLELIRRFQPYFDEEHVRDFTAAFEAEIRLVAEREGDVAEHILRLTNAKAFDHHCTPVPCEEAARRTGVDDAAVHAIQDEAVRQAADAARRRAYGTSPTPT
jgi:hypothetical protein